MLRAAAIACVVLGVWLSPARAAEPSIFEAYKAVCQDTRADPQKALAALGPGWDDSPIPAPDAATRMIHRVRTIGTERRELLMIERVIPKGSDQSPFAKRMRVCMLTTSSLDSGLQASVSAMMGAPPNAHPDGGALEWTYVDAPAGREYYTGGTAAETNARVAKAPLVIVLAGETPQGGVAGFTEVSALGE